MVGPSGFEPLTSRLSVPLRRTELDCSAPQVDTPEAVLKATGNRTAPNLLSNKLLLRDSAYPQRLSPQCLKSGTAFHAAILLVKKRKSSRNEGSVSEFFDASLMMNGNKCFKDPQGFEKPARVNLVVGRNNTGKSTLMELLRYAVDPAENVGLLLSGAEAYVEMKFSLDNLNSLIGRGSPHDGAVNNPLFESEVRFSLSRHRREQKVLAIKQGGGVREVGSGWKLAHELGSTRVMKAASGVVGAVESLELPRFR